MILKDSLVDVFLYVGRDQSFPWCPLLPHLPVGLRQLSILPMLPTSKDAELAPSLSLYEAETLLKAYTLRKDTMRTIELRFLHTSVMDMALKQLRRLPHLKSLLLADPCPMLGFSEEDGDHHFTMEDDTSESWPALEHLTIRGYPSHIANAILRASQSPSLTSLTIRTPGGSTPMSQICSTMAQKWSDSLEHLEYTGPTSWHDDPVIDGDHIMQSLTALLNLKKLHIDCRHVMSHLHGQHLLSIGSLMHKLEHIHLTSAGESELYSSHLDIFDLAALRPLPNLLTVTAEIGNIRNTILDETHESQTISSVRSICILSSRYGSAALDICHILFPQVTVTEHRYTPYVLVDTALFST